MKSNRIAAALLAALLLLPVFVSCGDTADAPDGTALTETAAAGAETSVAVETSYIETLGEKNFDGAAYRYVTNYIDFIEELNVSCGSLTGSVMNDAQYNRDALIEDRYNVVIEYPAFSNVETAVTNAALAGEEIGDVYVSSLSDGESDMGAVFLKGGLHNLLEVPYLSLDSGYWSSLTYRNLQYNGKMFYTSGDMAPFTFISPACIYINLKLAEDYSVDENVIYQTVYDGGWTFDTLYGYTNGLDADLNGDGKMHCLDDFYGIVNEYNSLTSTLLLVACGVELCHLNDDGSMSIDLGSARTVEAIDKLASQFKLIENNGDNTLLFDDTFKHDRALFAVHYVESTLRRFRDMDSDYALLPMPKYEESQSSYVSYINPWANAFVAVPLVQNNIERTGFLTEVMEYYSVDMVRPAVYEISLKGKALRNEDSIAMLDMIYDTTYTDFNGIYQFGGALVTVNGAIFNDKPYMSNYEAVAEKVDSELAAFLEMFE